MTVEADICTALEVLVADQCYPDQAPPTRTVPYIVYQQVGGVSYAVLEGTAPSKRNGRFQVRCWAGTRAAAANLARSAEDTLITNTTLRAFALGAMVATYDEETNLFGTLQDFSIAY